MTVASSHLSSSTAPSPCVLCLSRKKREREREKEKWGVLKQREPPQAGRPETLLGFSPLTLSPSGKQSLHRSVLSVKCAPSIRHTTRCHRSLVSGTRGLKICTSRSSAAESATLIFTRPRTTWACQTIPWSPGMYPVLHIIPFPSPL